MGGYKQKIRHLGYDFVTLPEGMMASRTGNVITYEFTSNFKAFLASRTLSIQAELDKVQETLKASQDKVTDAQKKLEEAKKLSSEIVESAKADVDSIKQKVMNAIDTDIANLNKNLDEMMKVEISKAKKQVVTEVLDELLSSGNIQLTQSELVNIVLKKVA